MGLGLCELCTKFDRCWCIWLLCFGAAATALTLSATEVTEAQRETDKPLEYRNAFRRDQMQCAGVEIRQLSRQCLTHSHSRQSRVCAFFCNSAAQARAQKQANTSRISSQVLMATASRAAEFGLSSQQLDELVKDSVVWANQHGLVSDRFH